MEKLKWTKRILAVVMVAVMLGTTSAFAVQGDREMSSAESQCAVELPEGIKVIRGTVS